MRFQSFFMLITTQPLFFTSAIAYREKCPPWYPANPENLNELGGGYMHEFLHP